MFYDVTYFYSLINLHDYANRIILQWWFDDGFRLISVYLLCFIIIPFLKDLIDFHEYTI